MLAYPVLQYFRYKNPLKTNKVRFFFQAKIQNVFITNTHTTTTITYTALGFLFCSGKRKKKEADCVNEDNFIATQE